MPFLYVLPFNTFFANLYRYKLALDFNKLEYISYIKITYTYIHKNSH